MTQLTKYIIQFIAGVICSVTAALLGAPLPLIILAGFAGSMAFMPWVLSR